MWTALMTSLVSRGLFLVSFFPPVDLLREASGSHVFTFVQKLVPVLNVGVYFVWYLKLQSERRCVRASETSRAWGYDYAALGKSGRERRRSSFCGCLVRTAALMLMFLTHLPACPTQAFSGKLIVPDELSGGCVFTLRCVHACVPQGSAAITWPVEEALFQRESW